MNTTDVLRQAKELLSDERNWTQCGATYVRRDDGGTSYCVYGAVSHVLGGGSAVAATHPATRAFQSALGGAMIGAFNDSTTHADLIAAFDRALLLVAGETPVEREVPVAA